MFLLYVVFVAIIIMNLLVGLTVSKIEELLKRGGIIQAEKRVHYIFGMSKIGKRPWINHVFKICSKVFKLQLRPVSIMKNVKRKVTSLF